MLKLLVLPLGFLFCLNLPAQTLQQVAADSVDLRIFEKVDIEAAYPGGETGWRRLLERNLNGNVPTDRGAPIGMYTVIVQFVVDKLGSISDIKALTKNGYGTEEEVVRVIKNSGSWTPAYQNGRAVKAYRKQPVTFVVIDDDIEVESKLPYRLLLNKDNRVTITVNKVAAENIEVAVPEGVLVRNQDNSYTVHPVKPGRMVLVITNTKKQKEIGRVSFQVVTQ